jgi:hypothetical protein
LLLVATLGLFAALMRRFQQAAIGCALALAHDFGRAEE